MRTLTPIPSPNAGYTTTVVGSPSGEFVPSSGLLAWYLAETVYLGDTDPVTVWYDGSGNGYDLSAVGTPPILDLSGAFPVVRWDGAAGYLASVSAFFSAGQDRTIVLVYQSDDSAADYDICGQGDNSLGGGWAFMVYNDSGADPSVTTGGTPVASPTVFGAGYKWAMAKYNAGALQITSPDGTNSNAQAVADASVPFTVGRVPGTYSTNPFKGSVAELLVYDHVLTAGEQTALVGYLETKYSL